MNLLSIFSAKRDSRPLARIADDIARGCQGRAWELVRESLDGMSRAETRGYIRAKTARLVGVEVAARAATMGGDAAAHSRLAEETVRLLIERIARLRDQALAERFDRRRAA